jgi:hypothetical protein
VDPARAAAKHASAEAGYQLVFGVPPTVGETRYLLAVAEHETQCGDGMRGDLGSAHNWGAVQWRAPIGHEVDAINAGVLHVGSMIPGGILRQDTSPARGKYWVWFRAYADDAHGAASLCTTLYKGNVNAKAVAVANGTPTEFATAMYLHGYFEGFHKGARHFSQRALPLTAPELANVADYAASLTRQLAVWSATLSTV